MPDRPAVLIYRNTLLPISETFILAQALALKNFHPRLAGGQRAAPSLTIPSDSITAVTSSGSLARLAHGAFRRFGLAPGFYSKVRQTRARLIHAHFAPDGAEALFLSRKLGLPLIVTLHGFDVSMHDSAHTNSRLGRLYLRRRDALWREASTFICVSDFVRNQALANGFPGAKLVTHYIGVDRSIFDARTNRPERETVLFVGRLVEKKGCEYLLRAMKFVQRERKGAELMIIGDGPLMPKLKILAAELGVNAAFLGPQPVAAVRQSLNHASVFCVPSVTAKNGDSEGLGMVFLEAQATGVPVVSFRHGGIPEAVDDGKTGLLAPEGDSDTLAAHLLSLLGDAGFRDACGARGVQWVKQRFDLATQTAALEDLYGRIIG